MVPDAGDRVARDLLEDLSDGFHYATLRYEGVEGERVPAEVVWNYELRPEVGSRRDDLTDRKTTERHRELAIEHQQQYQKHPERTEQAELTEAVSA